MKTLSLLKKYIDKISKTNYQTITGEVLNNIPKDIGIYFFRNKKSNKVEYVGTATGQKGLRQRVRNQHLNPNYIKSVFRNKVSADKRKHIKEECVDFIKNNYRIAMLPIPEHISIIKALEQIYIYEYLPKYNSETEKYNHPA